MPSKSVVIRHNHPGPSAQGSAALAAAKAVVMRRAMEVRRQEAKPQSVSKPA